MSTFRSLYNHHKPQANKLQPNVFWYVFLNEHSWWENQYFYPDRLDKVLVLKANNLMQHSVTNLPMLPIKTHCVSQFQKRSEFNALQAALRQNDLWENMTAKLLMGSVIVACDATQCWKKKKRSLQPRREQLYLFFFLLFRYRGSKKGTLTCQFIEIRFLLILPAGRRPEPGLD